MGVRVDEPGKEPEPRDVVNLRTRGQAHLSSRANRLDAAVPDQQHAVGNVRTCDRNDARTHEGMEVLAYCGSRRQPESGRGHESQGGSNVGAGKERRAAS
jgi:hypothetical protein